MWSDVEFEIDVGEEIAFDIADGQAVEFGEDEYIAVVSTEAPTYDGPYEAVPTGATQTFSTGGKVMASDFTVAPIPSNYGLIEWDGSVLRVS